MIRLSKVEIDGRTRWYLIRGPHRLPSCLALEKPESVSRLDKIGHCRFYLHSPSQTLLKVKPDKYSVSKNPIRWLGRILVQERLLLQLEARKEYAGNRRVHRAGLDTLNARGWAMALNPFNRFGSIYLVEYCTSAISGEDHFNTLSVTERYRLTMRICQQTLKLAQAGYYNRDQHLGNFLVTDEKGLIWIDTHLSRLPMRKQRAKQELIRSIVRKMPDARCREYAREILSSQTKRTELG